MTRKITLLLVGFLFLTLNFFAQEITVKGKVSDKSGELPGVSVSVKGTTKGTSTGFNGMYSIKVEKGAVLVFSSLGMKSKEITVNSATHNVTLEEDTNVLNEVVVTAFGLKKKEKSLGYSVQKVKASDIKIVGNANPLSNLQGQVAGVYINKTSGSVGGGVDILIRGITSIDPTRSNQPLIIIDGVVTNGDTFSGSVGPSAGSNATGSNEQFNFSSRSMDINPDDIEEYNVLKGAAATALYGSKAANGAIVITTKQGKAGKAKFNINTSTTIREVVKTPGLQTKYREGHRTSGRPGAITDYSELDGYDDHGFAFYTWGPEYTADSWDYGGGVIGDLSNDKFHNMYDDFFNTGTSSQINFNVSGLKNKLNYFISLGNSKDEGVVPNTNYRKTNARVKLNYSFNDKLSVGFNVAHNNSGGARSNGGDKSIFSSLSYWSPTIDINNYLNADGTQRNYTKGIIDNPKYFAETSNQEDLVKRWVANISANWSPKEWLDVAYRAQYDTYSDDRNRFVPSDLDVGTQVGGFVVEEEIDFKGYESTLLGTFKYDISEDLKTSLLVGHQVRSSKRNYNRVRGEGLIDPFINSLSNTTNIFNFDEDIVEERDMGVFGELKIDYKDKLFLSITGRNDWLSVLPEQNRSFFYPSVSASYLFNQDIDLDKKVLSFGKLRASWAKVGKGPSANRVGYYFVKDLSFSLDQLGGFVRRNIVGDPNMTPEFTTSFEVGTDLRFLDNRIRLDYSYYHNTVDDQIIPVSQSPSTGTSTLIRNAGQLKLWGHEVLLTADIVKKENFKWTTSINWSTSEGVASDLPDDLEEIVFFGDRITAKVKEGDKLGTLYGWKFQTAPNGERYVGADGKWVITGSENDGFYYENDNEMVKVGNAFPDYIASLRNDITWKNFNLSFLLEYKSGGDVYDRGFRNSLRNGNLAETEFRNEERVLQGVMDNGSGGFTANTTPLLITADSYYRDFDNYNSASEVLLEDASWVKIRNISLSYSLPQSMLRAINIDNITASASVSNIILWTPFKGFDPESNQFSASSNIYGFTGLNVPLSQDYSLGLKIQF